MSASIFATQAQSRRHEPVFSSIHTHLDFDKISQSPLINLADGQAIYNCDETAGRIYRVEWGAVRLYRLAATGRRHVVAFHLAGEWFGFQNEGVRRFSAEAVGSAALRGLSMLEAMQMSFDLLPACLESLSWSREHQLLMGRQGAVERLAAFLCEMSDRSGGFKRFELQMPRIDVADYLGLTVETVSRAVTRLRSANIIRLHGKRGIEILNREALMGLCS